MVNLIINADDLGLNPIVNQSIEEALCSNSITSATIMANSDYMDEVVRIANLFSEDKSFGVHLNITEGKSMTNSPLLKKAGMIDENGNFIKSNNYRSRLFDEKVIEEIEKEWDAQVYELLSKGVKVSHIDGHHHCHTWLGYSKPLLSIMQKYGINKVRNILSLPIIPYKERLVLCIAKGTMCLNFKDSESHRINRLKSSIIIRQDKLRYIEATKIFNKTDYFESYDSFMRCTSKNMEALLSKETSVELMCHPGHPNYAKEYELIKHDKPGFKTNTLFRLINYNDL